MKNTMRYIVVLFILFLRIGFEIGTAQESVMGNVEVNYETNQIHVRCKTNVNYIQRISVVMFRSEVEKPNISDFVRVGEGTTEADGSCVITFQLGEDIKTADYTFEISGSGKAGSVSRVVQSVMGLGDAKALKDEINRAQTVEEMAEVTVKVAAVLKIDMSQVDDYEKDLFYQTLLQVRKDDFSDRFSSLSQFKTAWDITQTLMSLEATVSAEELGKIMPQAAEILGITIPEEHTEGIYRVFYNLIQELNSDNGRMSRSKSFSAFREATAVGVINESSVEELEENLVEYGDILALNEILPDYLKLQENDKLKVGRVIKDKTYDNANDVKKAFEFALNEISDKESGGGTSQGTGTASNSGGSAAKNTIGSGSIHVPIAQNETNETNEKKQPFHDLGEVSWAEDSILALYEKGIIDGYTEDRFEGNKMVTREAFVKMLVIGLDLFSPTSQCDFDDVEKTRWSYPYIASAVEKGIVYGVDNTVFGAEQLLQRQDMAVMLERILEMLKEEPEEGTFEAQKFLDQEDISEYARSSVEKMHQLGIVNGYENGKFMPREGLTRAEAAEVIYRFLALVHKI